MSHVRGQIHIVARFLKFTEQRNLLKLDNLHATDIYAAFEASASKGNFHHVVSAFLKYAYKYKLMNTNLALVVPSAVRRTTVPSVYSPDEVERLLNAIDRSTNIGKRDYALILMAARLGLRASNYTTFNI